MSNLKDYKWTYYRGVEGFAELDLHRDVQEGGAFYDQVFVHCQVSDSSFKSLTKCRDLFKEIKEWAKFVGYEDVYTFTDNVRWCKILDSSFTHLATVPHLGQKYEVLGWSLEQSQQ